VQAIAQDWTDTMNNKGALGKVAVNLLEPQQSLPNEEVLTTEEAAKYLKIHPRTLTRFARAGNIPSFQIGTHWRFLRSALDEWMHSEVTSNTNSSLSASTGKER
jgi:excisionase family DNA binding protein